MSVPKQNESVVPLMFYFALIGGISMALLGAIFGWTGLVQTEYKSLPPISHAVHIGLAGAIGGATTGFYCGLAVAGIRLFARRISASLRRWTCPR